MNIFLPLPVIVFVAVWTSLDEQPVDDNEFKTVEKAMGKRRQCIYLEDCLTGNNENESVECNDNVAREERKINLNGKFIWKIIYQHSISYIIKEEECGEICKSLYVEGR